ncbi:hypothetical protein M2281_000645 [Mesorhizobium soli]|nr:hypothetical protein [Mesorhizobium soli]
MRGRAERSGMSSFTAQTSASSRSGGPFPASEAKSFDFPKQPVDYPGDTAAGILWRIAALPGVAARARLDSREPPPCDNGDLFQGRPVALIKRAQPSTVLWRMVPFENSLDFWRCSPVANCEAIHRPAAHTFPTI